MEIEFHEEIDRLSAAFLALGLLLGFGASFTLQQTQSGGQLASDNLVSFLENRSQENFEVIDVEEAGTFYKVNVKTSGNQLQTYYTGNNGKLFTSDMQSTEMIKHRTKALTNFRNCLARRNVTMYGNSSTQETKRQIEILGGAGVVAPIYKDVTNTTNRQEAVDSGIQRTPAFLRNGEYIQGVNTLPRIEQFSKCNYPLN